ncbi:fatty acid hydroxylase family protein [Leptospira fainei serovar Hurstbridge str. BUT 6]|uniref:Fatty acid hydroxylase family protein n=1 Tax=Leptospira fainei serovar Hurstbridge str. BUT 6 TaxID=1193011 RepID=S3UVU7_9LEPT|nr:sterol desaturase family protein [Leptospira fainei]EPG73388.1 fatty acid hydroxylase family protein [Leptospira fainei serovar Hurstbridge str. BUT 6]
MNKLITYFLYPVLLSLNIGFIGAALVLSWELKYAFIWISGFNAIVLLIVEFVFPLKQEWKMTKKSFVRDLKWMSVTILSINAVKFFFAFIAIALSRENKGLFRDSSFIIESVAIAVIFEFGQYWYHRISHEGKGWIGKWLWSIHVAHHLPDRVYLLMHPVLHPINTIVIQVIIQGTFLLLGCRPESIFIFNVLLGLHELFSHFNVNIKAGPLNYIFIGTELHRFHHSANLDEAKNYGTFLSLWDIVFGTFVYRSESIPEKLGVPEPENYPNSSQLIAVMSLPFTKLGNNSEL